MTKKYYLIIIYFSSFITNQKFLPMFFNKKSIVSLFFSLFLTSGLIISYFFILSLNLEIFQTISLMFITSLIFITIFGLYYLFTPISNLDQILYRTYLIGKYSFFSSLIMIITHHLKNYNAFKFTIAIFLSSLVLIIIFSSTFYITNQIIKRIEKGKIQAKNKPITNLKNVLWN